MQNASQCMSRLFVLLVYNEMNKIIKYEFKMLK